jgi:hypothetical protein
MTELYRGLLLVLTEKFTDLISTLRMHIRSFRSESKDPSNYMDVGVSGFWNFILEVIFTLFAISCLSAGVVLTAMLAIIAYPLKATLNVSSYVLRSIRHPQQEGQFGKISPEFDDPIISKKADGKEKK